MAAPEWEEVKNLLDDPNVPHDQKRELALAYAAEDDWQIFGVRDEVEPYLAKYDDGYWRATGEGISEAFNRPENLEDKFNAAKESADKGAEAEKEHDRAVEDGNGVLAESRKSSQEGGHGGAGVANSNELLDAGKPGLRFFNNFVPLYHEIEQDYNDKSKVPKLEKVKERYDEQRDIDFDKFERGIDDLAAAEKALRTAHQDMSGKLGGLWNSWTGGAAQASQSYFADSFTPTVNDRVVQTVSDAASATEQTLKSVGDLVRAKAQSVLDMDAEDGKLAGKSVQDWDTTIQVANNTDDDTTLRTACTVWGIEISQDCGGDLDEEIRQKIKDECEKVTRHTFAKTVEDQCQNFNKLCDDTRTKVDDAWKALNEELGKAEENPFQNPGGDEKPGGQSPAPTQQGSVQQGGQQGAGGAGGGAGAGGAGAGGAGAAGGGMPEAPEAPEAPRPGAPGENPEQPEQLEEVTLGEGQEAVSVREADEQGTTQVTLTGADGRPKTYDVSFGPEGGRGPGEPGQRGEGAGAGPMPESASGQGQAMPGQASGAPVQAGPDGKAVIEEGGRTITLERAPDGGVQVAIDNGQGRPPLNQTIDFGADEASEPPTGAGIGEPASGAPPGLGGAVGEPAAPQADIGGPPPPPDVGGGMGEPAPAPEPGMPPPQVDGFDAPPRGVPVGMPAEVVPPGLGSGAGDIGAMPADGVASTTPQSAGMTSMSGLGEGAQNSFGSTSGQLPGMGEDAAGGPEEDEASGRRGAPGMASLGGGAAGGEPQGAGGMASMGDPGGAQGGQGSGQGAAGGGMMGGMGAMGGAQQQGGDQERSNDSPWRTQGQLFDDGIEASNVRFRSVLGEDKAK